MLFQPTFTLGTDGPAPTFVAAGSQGNGTSAALPSGWAVGDLHIIVAGAYKTTSSTGHSTPAGWTLLATAVVTYAGIYQVVTKVFYRFAQSGDSTVSLTSADGSTLSSSVMLGYRGANPSSPFEGTTNLDNQTTATSLPYAQITTGGANRVVLQIFGPYNPGGNSGTPAASWTERFESVTQVLNSVDERTFAASGLTASGNRTLVGTATWCRIAFAIKPT